MSGVSLSSSPPFTTFSSIQSNSQTPARSSFVVFSNYQHGLSSFSGLMLRKRQWVLGLGSEKQSNTASFRCNSSTGGDNESKDVLDAFFLGRALAEAASERIESAVGEFLSTIGRLQAEQQRQIQKFQEDVLERAKKAKEQAAREALEAQGLVPKPPTAASASTTYGNNSASSSPSSSAATPTTPSPNSTTVRTAQTGSGEKGPSPGISNDDE